MRLLRRFRRSPRIAPVRRKRPVCAGTRRTPVQSRVTIDGDMLHIQVDDPPDFGQFIEALKELLDGDALSFACVAGKLFDEAREAGQAPRSRRERRLLAGYLGWRMTAGPSPVELDMAGVYGGFAVSWGLLPEHQDIFASGYEAGLAKPIPATFRRRPPEASSTVQ